MANRRDVLAEIYGRMKAVMMALGRETEAELTRSGMSVAQMILLYTLIDEGSRTPRALANRLGVTPGNVTRLVEKLEALGYVSRTRSSEDLRLVHVDATAAGRAAIQGGFDAQADVLTRAFGEWSDPEVRKFHAMLGRLTPKARAEPANRLGSTTPAPARPAPKARHERIRVRGA